MRLPGPAGPATPPPPRNPAPVPRPVPPPPRPARFTTPALLVPAAVALASGLTLLVAVASRINGVEALRGAWSVVLLLSLVVLHVQTSRLIPRLDRPLRTARAHPSARPSEGWGGTAG